jgi:hypothetical protein
VKQYAKLHDVLVGAFRAFAKDVSDGAFPTDQHSVAMDPAEYQELRRAMAAPTTDTKGMLP